MLVSVSQLLSKLVNKSPKQSFKESVVAISVVVKSENIWLKITEASSIALTKQRFQTEYVYLKGMHPKIFTFFWIFLTFIFDTEE